MIVYDHSTCSTQEEFMGIDKVSSPKNLMVLERA
jgi:hypothetical protein